VLGSNGTSDAQPKPRLAEEVDVVEKQPQNGARSVPTRPSDSGLPPLPGGSGPSSSSGAQRHVRQQDAKRSGPSDPPDRP
jgi:hypothetical protein